MANPQGNLPTDEQPLITYQGYKCVDGNMARSVGLNPDKGKVTIPKSEFKKLNLSAGIEIEGTVGGSAIASPSRTQQAGGFEVSGDLVFTLRGKSVTFQKIFISEEGIREIEVADVDETPVGPGQQGEPATLIEVGLQDIRFKWAQRGIVSLDRNVRVDGDHGGRHVVRIEPHGLFDKRTLKEEKKLWPLDELINVCVEQLEDLGVGSFGEAVVFGVERFPTGIEEKFPFDVKWGSGTKAAEALDKLLRGHSLILVLTRKNVVKIYELGEVEDPTPDTAAKSGQVSEKFRSARFQFSPKAVEVVGGRTIDEKIATTWEPVVEWDGSSNAFRTGEMVNLFDALGAWGGDDKMVRRQVLKHFSRKSSDAFEVLRIFTPRKFFDQRKKILAEQAFHWFRMTGPVRNFLPALSFRPRLSEGLIKFERQAPLVYADKFVQVSNRTQDKKAKEETDPGFWKNLFMAPCKADEASFDEKNGVIKFKRPMGWLEMTIDEQRDPDTKKKIQKFRNYVVKRDASFEAVNQLFFRQESNRVTYQELQKQEAATYGARIPFFMVHGGGGVPDIFVGTIAKAFDLQTFVREFVFIEDMELNLPGIMVVFAWERNNNQPDDWFRFKLELKKDAPAFLISDRDLVEVHLSNGETNVKELKSIARKKITDALFKQVVSNGTQWTFAGIHDVALSGNVHQIVYDSDGDDCWTKVQESNLFRGFDGRPGGGRSLMAAATDRGNS